MRPINERTPASHPWTSDARTVSDVRSSSVSNVLSLLTGIVDGRFLRTEMSDSQPPSEFCTSLNWALCSQQCLSTGGGSEHTWYF